MFGRRVALLSFAALAPLLLATAARAQEEPDSARILLDPLIVEALRLPSGAREAPYSVSVVDATATRVARSGRSLSEALRAVPGVQVSDRSNDALGDRIVIRGVGSRAGFGVRGVRVLIDGIPATLPDGQTDLSRLDLATVGRIEVLRGPAAALYGNASGGVIRISSRAPSLDPFEVEGEAMAGEDGLLRLHGRVSGAPGLTWYDASATHRASDGFRTYNASEKTFVRAAAGLPLATGHLVLQASGNQYDADNPGALTAAQLDEMRDEANPLNLARRAGEDARAALAGAQWTGTVGPGVLELTTYGMARSLENPIPVSIIEIDRRVGGVGAAWGYAWLVVGAEMDLQRDDRRNFENLDGEAGDTTLDQLEHVRGLGAFAQARVPFGDRVTALAALRYDRLRFEVDDRWLGDGSDDSGDRTMDALSPSIGMHARVGSSMDLFANLASAFETPTTTELANRPDGTGGFNPDLEPQRSLAFETGLRGYAFDRVRFELTGWAARTEDALIASDSLGRQFFRNAGSTEAHGIELALLGNAPMRFQWDLSYAFIDARFDAFADDGGTYDGNDVPGIAPHRLTVGLTRSTPSTFVGVEATHSAAMQANDPNTAQAAGWTTVDVRGQLRLLDRAGGVWLFSGATNVLDEEYVGSVVVNAFGGRYYEPSPGRGFYVGVRAGGR